MRKNKSRIVQEFKPSQNPVAKFAVKFNKYQIISSKKQYRRHQKHKGQEPFVIRYAIV